MKYKNSDNIEINGDLKNGDVICGNGSINIHTLYQCNESISFNDMDRDVKNGDMSGRNCFMISQTLSEAKNLRYLDSTKKRDGNDPNVHITKYT